MRSIGPPDGSAVKGHEARGMWKALDYADIARFCNASGAHATTIDAVRIGLTLDPDNAMLYVYRAAAYDEFGRSSEAIADCETAIRLAPGSEAAALAGITLALVRERSGDFAGAIAAATAAIAIDPAGREAHAALGTVLARHGMYRAAWPELECHWIDERITFMQRFRGRTEWNGEDISGLRLLLVHGQGLGDLIQLLRYVPRVRERAASVVLECPDALLELARALLGADAVVAKGAIDDTAFDVYGRMSTLPRLCDEDGTPGRSGVPYLHAPAARTASWAQRLGARDGRRRIGLVWAGNPAHPNDRRRSIPLERLAPLASVAGVHWISLQAGIRAGDVAPSGLELTRFEAGAFASLADTAALLANLDLAIAVDTAVAHLAGALNVPVWLLLPRRPDWRWSPVSDTTPWYPSMRLFHAGDPTWDGPLAALTAALATPLRPTR